MDAMLSWGTGAAAGLLARAHRASTILKIGSKTIVQSIKHSEQPSYFDCINEPMSHPIVRPTTLSSRFLNNLQTPI
jgi:hypothetical protein